MLSLLTPGHFPDCPGAERAEDAANWRKRGILSPPRPRLRSVCVPSGVLTSMFQQGRGGLSSAPGACRVTGKGRMSPRWPSESSPLSPACAALPPLCHLSLAPCRVLVPPPFRPELKSSLPGSTVLWAHELHLKTNKGCLNYPLTPAFMRRMDN